jgi:hypothetical protein
LAAGAARIAALTRNDRRHDDTASEPLRHAIARIDDASGDLMPQDQRQRVPCRNATERKPDIGMTQPAPRDLDNDFVVAGLQRR